MYKLNQDPDLELKTILDRKSKYHKEMVKFFKLIQQTRSRKLVDFLNESKDSSINEYISIVVSINSHNLVANYSLYPLLIPVSNFRNIEDIYFGIYLINEFVEKERKTNEISEVTPVQHDDSHADEADASRIITIPHEPTYYDPELATLVAKYHKMEKHTPKLFSDVELVQGPLHLISSILNQENTIKNESSKLIGSGSSNNPISEIFKTSQKQQKGFKNIPESKLTEEMSLIEIERFDLIEERVQFMLEYLISKGTCSFLEQNESKNAVIKKLVKSLKVLKEKQRVPKDEENKNAQSNVGMFTSSCKHIFDEIFKQSYFIKIQSWKESNIFDSFESSDEVNVLK